MTSSFKTKRLVESALMIALAAILSFIFLFRLPFGGSITAVLLNTPGAPPAVCTAMDGYPLAKQGKAG